MKLTLDSLNARIRDHLSLDWLTPSEQAIWDQIHLFEGPPHRIINIYGVPGSGKTFLGWLMQREGYATYGLWSSRPSPVHARLTLDNSPTSQAAARDLRPLVDELGVRQIILLSRRRVDEPAMPAFELQVTPDDLEHLRGNLYRHLDYILPDVQDCRSYHEAIAAFLKKSVPDGRE
ncbi:hypothetical protein FBQ96_16720 [Nitrospirales bacterium NOB]|nr:hypothetical protein [Nitrospirales bacterium NOB]RIK23319.1 MAG: hypothetical protein DCC51_03830 [Anaerolineae bacterium]